MPSNKRRPKDDEVSLASEGNKPLKNVPALMGEGEKFFRDKLYDKAIQCYSEALDMSPENKNALVERSSCYLKTGRNDLALADAEESLKENKEFTKGLYQKAEALYAMGEFEMALVFYHRGKKIRPDVKEFQMGINKAEEAIDNCVGDPNSVKLEVKGDLSYFDKPDQKNKQQSKPGYIKPAQKQSNVNKREKRNPNKTGTQKTVKQLLGELYADKVYLEKLLEDDSKRYNRYNAANNNTNDSNSNNHSSNATKQHSKSGDAIWKLANNGLDFLDSRTEFWRQQKPIYARQKKYNRTEKDTPLNYILKQLEVIDSLQSVGKNQESLEKSNRLMSYVNKQSDSQLPEKKEITSHVYSNIGNANLEMGKYAQALDAHNKDLDISKEIENKEGISRAHENIGRVYARNGRYKEAIAAWEKKLPMAESDMENAWLYHEIGRCYLELGNYEKAREFGKRSFEFADKMDDNHWKLNATVLIAQSEAKMNDAESLKSAIGHFEKAIDIAESQEDEAAKKAITKAMEDCKTKLKKVEAGEDVSKDDKDKKPAKDTRPSLANNTNNKPKNDKDSKKGSDSSSKVMYEIEVKTHDEMGAGTDGEVFISLIGDKGSELEVPLAGSRSKKNQFEKGSVDKFDVELKNIGKLSKIVLEQQGPKAGTWKPDYVRVAYGKAIYLFEIDKWFDPDTGVLKMELTPSGVEDNNTKYEISIQTDEEKGAGTDSNITIVIHGADKSVTLPLKTHDATSANKNLFEQGQLDVFHIYGKDVGTLKRITVESDGKGMGASWKVNTIKIVNNGKTYIFTVNEWIKKNSVELKPDETPAPAVAAKKDENDKKPATDTKPPAPATTTNKDNKPKTDNKDNNKPAPPASKDNKDSQQRKASESPSKVMYEVEVKTHDEMGAGTDGEVFISLIGDKGSELVVPLSGSRSKKNQFEKGSVDKFDLELKNIGKLSKIVLEQQGPKAGTWKPDYVKVSYGKAIYLFEIDKWFDPDTGVLKMELTPSGVEDNNTKYEISIQTDEEKGAGTDSNITIVIHGADKSVTLPLKTHDATSANKNLFEQGQLDVFHIYGKDVGTLKRITVESDGKGMGASWKINNIKVVHNGKTHTFTVNDWLKKSSIELTPDGPGGPVPPKREESPNVGEERERGIEAAERLEKEKAERERKEKQGRENKEKEEKEKRDKEEKERKEKEEKAKAAAAEKERKEKEEKEKAEREKAEKERKEKEEKAKADKDKAEKEKADKEKADKEKLDKDKAEKARLEKERAEKDRKEKYEIHVKTCDEVGAGTDGEVFISLHGDKADELDIPLTAASNSKKNMFERGQIDRFEMELKNIGKLAKIDMEQRGGKSGAWKLDYVKVIYNNQIYMFDTDKWLDPDTKTNKIELKPTSVEDGLEKYEIEVKTCSDTGAGTDSGISLTLFGGKQQQPGLELALSTKDSVSDYKDLFETDQEDKFAFFAKDIGPLTKISIGIDGKGLSADWKLQHVKITYKKQVYTFTVNKWIKKGQLELFPDGSTQPSTSSSPTGNKKK